MKVNLNTNNIIHSLEELALATGRVPHDAHVDVPTEMSPLHGRLGHTTEQHQ